MPHAELVTRSVAANGQVFALTTAGDPSAMPVLFLHGFPEHRGAWDDTLRVFGGRVFAIAPDQRGYGGSSKPADVASYRVSQLVADMIGVMDAVAPGRTFHLVGHDWGASVAYALAFALPQRVSRLVIINGVHPVLFQRALATDPDQIAASQYMHFLKDARAEALLSENNFRRLEGFLTKFGNSTWLTDEKTAAYHAAWAQPGALTGMLNWYRASPIVVPKVGEKPDLSGLPQIDLARMKVVMPHLLIWGEEDPALRPVTWRGLDTFARDVRVVEVSGADHWVIHQAPAVVHAAIEAFLEP